MHLNRSAFGLSSIFNTFHSLPSSSIAFANFPAESVSRQCQRKHLAIHITILEASPTGLVAVLAGEPSVEGIREIPAVLDGLPSDGFGYDLGVVDAFLAAAFLRAPRLVPPSNPAVHPINTAR